MVRCCSAQIQGSWEDPGQTLEAAENCFSRAAHAGAALIAFPEQFATGWDPCSQKNTEDLSGAIVTSLSRLAKKHSLAVIGSFRETSFPKPKNTAVAIDRDGRTVATYSKIHLFTPGHEDDAFAPGTRLAVFTLDGAKIGLAICYDLRFPELFRLYRREEVHAVIVPAAWPARRMSHWELFIRSRAAENQMYVAGINTIGSNPVDRYTGGSLTADPHGSLVARAGPEPELLFYDIEPGLVEQARHDFPVERDRKDALYGTLLREDRE